MDPQSILGFAAVSIALAFTPGADWAYCIAAGMGRHRVAPAVAGLCTGYLMHTLLVVAGVAALVASRPQLLTWLTVVGAGYLLWLGISTARSWRAARFAADAGEQSAAPAVPARVPALVGASGTTTAEPALAAEALVPAGQGAAQGAAVRADRAADRRNYLRGLGTSGTNPKALLLYLALIPQFISPNALLPVPAQTGAFGLAHMLVSAVVYSGVALGARRLLRSRPAAARVVTLASGVIMIGLGVVLLAEQLPELADSARQLLAVVR
ncbi:LysE family translocator [Arthrobacter sp. I2-34]|uniref:LysE family translocator n=1 Tax=Arthrobacter hankyongi TaxID=2904801 RepID=A0ABS9L3L5_9MICC|nr:LysE family translocator [Arthrobacter hankyongi]MCG2621082.1 LysE family translocator [Arthrobacter hankyongi]